MLSFFFVLIFGAVLVAAVLAAKLPEAVAALYLAFSTITFIAYACDKSAARAGRWRTPEATLHALALFCGWPGAAIAQKVLHHKTKKQPFGFIFVATVLFNCSALAWFSVSGWCGH